MTTDLKVFPHFVQVCLCGCWEQEWLFLQLSLSSRLQCGILVSWLFPGFEMRFITFLIYCEVLFILQYCAALLFQAPTPTQQQVLATNSQTSLMGFSSCAISSATYPECHTTSLTFSGFLRQKPICHRQNPSFQDKLYAGGDIFCVLKALVRYWLCILWCIISSVQHL